MRFIVFTDLDGTLLDHDTYDWRPAAPVIERLRSEGWPLVFVTSKTRAEVEGLRREIGVDEPFIVENGAAAFFPERYADVELEGARRMGGWRAVVFGRLYQDARAFVHEARDAYGVEGFGDMSVDRVAALTGLAVDDARLAKEREFTEPFRLREGADLAGFVAAAERAGFKVTTGGRFHHLIGAGQDKGVAVRAVRAALEHAHGEAITVGLGDGENDVPMLEAVDEAVLVPAPGRPLPRVARERVHVAHAEGPVGWAGAVAALIGDPGP